jgi:DNA-binding MarR family transcriptional regulator/GNAT superfamily N-acetyltransferase
MKNETSVGEQQTAAIREFNRFYTAKLGLLRKGHLDSDFSLTESRLLYEIGATRGITAASLRSTLGLDAGYVSRILASLTQRKLIRQAPSRKDGREKLLSLSPAGDRVVAQINMRSGAQIRELLANVSLADRAVLVDSLMNVRSILRSSKESTVRILRISTANADAIQLLQEYYEAIGVVQRDTRGRIRAIIQAPASGVWLAYADDEPVGCVVLRKLESIPFAAECKRLYVRPGARGHHIASRLLDAQEDFARGEKLRWIYLDSYDDLKAAIALYRRRGYVPCERYNDNPQATIFFRKRI